MPGAGRPVGLLRRDDELAATADLHARNAVLPTLDETLQRECDRLSATPRAVEFFATVVVDADVVHLDGASGHGFWSIADDQILDDELCGSWATGKFNLRFA